MGITKKEFSNSDTIRDIKIPKKVDRIVSELIGIIIGDGHIGISKGIYNGNKYKHYEIRISGGLEDYQYHNKITKKYFEKKFNLNIKIKKVKSGSYLYLAADSKAVVFFFFKIVGIPLGNKTKRLSVPGVILNGSKEIKAAFLRGIADTDGCFTFKKKDKKKFHEYPVIKLGRFKSKELTEQISILLDELKINHYVCYDERGFDKRFNRDIIGNSIYINGVKNTMRWMGLINFSNIKQKSKYWVWKRFGFNPPYTTLIQRNLILRGALNPLSFYEN